MQSDGDAGTAAEVPWHNAEIADVARRLAVSPDAGLSAGEAASRLQSGGANRLAGPTPRSPWWLFLSQFKSVLILVLIGAAALAALIGNVRDAGVILAVVVINAIVGVDQEYRAERSLAALSEMLPQKSHARRDGQKLELEAHTLVRGDLVLLEAGDRVPADGRRYWQ